MKILVVEDSEEIRISLVKLLTGIFINCKIKHAVKFAEGKNALANNKFDLIILDLNLPDGSGIELIRKAKSIYGAKVIVFSSTSSQFIRTRALSLGADHFIDKTNEFDTFISTLEKMRLTT